MVAPAHDVTGHAEHQELGDRIRAFRRLRRMSLRAAATRAGVSPSFLSQLERGHTSGSIGSLRRIAQALGISIADLFHDDRPVAPRVLRRADRPWLDSEPGSRKYLITQRPLEHLEAYIGELEPGSSTGENPYTHGDSQEVFLVIRGAVTLRLGDSTHVLDTGDSIEYRSSVAHRVENHTDATAEVLWICSPPSPDED